MKTHTLTALTTFTLAGCLLLGGCGGSEEAPDEAQTDTPAEQPTELTVPGAGSETPAPGTETPTAPVDDVGGAAEDIADDVMNAEGGAGDGDEAVEEAVDQAPTVLEPPIAALLVMSDSFTNGEAIPMEFTCDGADASPPLTWTPGPAGTESYALIMDDPDAPNGTWTHWVAWNIPEPMLLDAIPAEAVLEDGIRQGMNSWPKLGYGGPCPPQDTGAHRYYFQIYALDAELDLPSTTTKDDLLAAMHGHILAAGELMGMYDRGE
jgi:Raf kinase inhibitor-like YbhB/YbcL family protein